MLVNCALSCEQCSTTDSTVSDEASLPAENIDSILGLEFGILQTIEGSEETWAKVQTVMREAGRFMEHYLAALKQKGISDIDALMQCYNAHRLCALWAAEGECTSNSVYMDKNCGPVCKSCELSSNPTVSINWFTNSTVVIHRQFNDRSKSPMFYRTVSLVDQGLCIVFIETILW